VTESRPAVIGAIVANLAIAVMKFVAAALSGSSAMISEGIHSLVDTGDGLLLFVGMRRSQRPPDDLHPFGHGKELYFWTLVVAVLVFAVGGGMSAYEGILHLIRPRAATHATWTYVVLSGALLFEGVSWTIAWRVFQRQRGRRRVWEVIATGKDPSVFAVLFEDSAAILGLLVALSGVFLSHQLDSPIPDGIASVAIGAILMVTAALLVRATLRLLVGQSADPELVRAIREQVWRDPMVRSVGRILTVHFGPDTIVVQIEIGFASGLGSEEVAGAIDRIQRGLTRAHPSLKHVFLEAERLADLARAPV
jgi:cation diffusion facilitator family transporter